ncbi:MAG: DUF4474 domain-containing protein [Clostridia bacterium]|nr:DUF4474 domain-containing protein [Clostridia bacterium]
MKRTLKSVLALLLCVLMLTPMMSLTYVQAATTTEKVTGLKIDSVTATTQKLTWNKMNGASGYYIYQYKSGSYKKIATVSSNSYTVKNLTNGKKYSYKIKAYDKIGVGSFSSSVSAFTVGSTGKISASSATTSSITLKWSAVSKATGYAVYMLKSGKYAKIASVKGKTTYKVTGLSAGTDYSFIVTAYISDGSVTTYGKQSAVKKLTTAPAAVKKLTASVTSDSVTLKWTKDSKATGYQVYKYNSSKKAYELAASVQNNTYKVKNLKSATTYNFKVRAYCSRNNTVYGAFCSAVKVKTLPPAAKIASDSSTANSVTIKWNKLSGVTGYEVWMLNGSKYTCVSRTSGNSYTRSGLSQGTKCTFKVRSFVVSEGNGTYYGDYSAPYTVATKPAAPANLKANAYSDDPIGLSWTAVNGVTGYKIYRKASDESSYSAIGLTASNSYVDKNVKNGITYSYKVQSYINGTMNVYFSNYSNVATAEYKETQKEKRTIQDTGVLGYLYNPKGNYFYTANDPWQRRLGFTSLYDSFSPATYMWYATERIRFSYDNLDWMIQVWKGQYGYAFIGGEVGVYTKEKTREVLFYDSASDANRLKMCFDYYTRLNGLAQFRKRFSTTYDYYWWCTGFIPGNKMFDMNRSNMRLDIRITMKDATMLNAFCAALENMDTLNTYPFYQKHYTRDTFASQSTYRVDGLDVYFSY